MHKLIENKYFCFFFIFLLGCATSFSLPPYNYFIINFFTFSFFFSILILKKNELNKITFFTYGWLFGFGYFSSNLYWISISLTFDESFKFLIPLSLILVPAFIGLFYGTAIYFFSHFIKKNNLILILVFSVLLGLTEFIRGIILTGFPWNLFAFSFSDKLLFIQILSITGTYGFNLLCITLFLLPVIFIFKSSKFEISVATILIIFFSSFLFFGYKNLTNNDNYLVKNNKFLIKNISSEISIDRFYNDLDEQGIIEELINLSEPDMNTPTIFVWPEGVLTSTSVKDIKKYESLINTNFSDNHLLIIGLNDILSGNEIKIYNSLALFNNNLDLIDIYYKNNLVPFGEFLPFKNFLSNFGLKNITNNYYSFSKGNERKVINLNDNKFNLSFLPLICYEIIYSGRLKKNNNFDIIINISEDGWFGNSIGPHQHFTHSIFRAIEEGKPILRSANNGISALIDHNGRIVKKLDIRNRGSFSFENLGYIKEKTFFSKYGNNIFFFLIIIYISFIFLIYKKKN